MTDDLSDYAEINTDIDTLIQYLLSKKKCSISELASKLGVSTKTVKQWLDVLEAEGYVQIKRSFFNEYVEWVGPEEDVVIQQDKMESEEQNALPESKVEEDHAKPRESEGEEKKEEKNAGIEPVLSDSMGDSIGELVVFDEDEEKKEEVGADQVEDESIEDQEEFQPVFVGEKEEVVEDKPLEFGKDFGIVEKYEVPKLESLKTFEEIQKKLNSIIKDIEQKKEEIKQLELKREALLEEELVPAEEEFRVSYEALLQKILDKKRRIYELQQQINTLFKDVQSVEAAEKVLKNVKHEASDVIQHNKNVINEIKEVLAKEESIVEQDLERFKDLIEKEGDTLITLEDKLVEINNKEDEIKGTITTLQKAWEEIGAQLEDAKKQLAFVEDEKQRVKAQLESVKDTLDDRKEELNDAYQRLKETTDVKQALDSYLNDYEEEIDKFANYIALLEAELADVKKEAQLAALNRYMDELSMMSGSYEEKLNALDEKQTDLDQKIEKAKHQLADLISKSKTLLKEMKVSPPSKFKEAVSSARSKASKVKKQTSKTKKEEEAKKKDAEKKSSAKTSKTKKTTASKTRKTKTTKKTKEDGSAGADSSKKK